MKLYVFIVLSFGCGPTAAGLCPPDWSLYERKCYQVLKEPFSWADGRSACEKLDAHIAAASSSSENRFIWNLFQKKKLTVGVWAGYSYINGSLQPSSQYTNWANNQPGGSWKCVGMGLESGGKWGIQLCSNIRAVVCERAPSSAPEVFCFDTDDNGRLTARGCIKSYTVRELRGGGVVSCGKACREELRCHSFNLLEEDGEMVCQLISANRHTVPPEAISDSKNCYHFDL